jgi:HTH-like domain
MRKKAVSPAHRRAVAQELVKNKACSQRAACRILRLARSTFRYRGRGPTPKEERLRKRLLELSAEHPRYGYRRIMVLLRREGWRVGKRHIQRLRRDEGLRVPPAKRKVIRRGVSTGLPTTATHRNHVWTWDFIADATVRGGALKMLTILDEYTRECHVLWAERTLKAADVLCWLEQPVAKRFCGKLSRTFPGRMFESGSAVDLDGDAGRGGRLPAEIQSGQTAQPAGLRKPGGFCGPELSIPSSGRASPSLRRGWTRNKQKHKLNQVPGLTRGLAQKGEPGHHRLLTPAGNPLGALVLPKSSVSVNRVAVPGS